MRKLIAVFLGVIYLGVLGASLVDAEAHAHRYCPEHGAIVHVDETSDANHSEPHSADSHSVCGFDDHLASQAQAGSSPGAAPAPISLGQARQWQPTMAAPASLARYQLAPKNSPPAQAVPA